MHDGRAPVALWEAGLSRYLPMSALPSVIVVNSLVSRGSVGGRASSFVLERLGFAVTFVPTVLLPWHPGHGPGIRIAVDPALLGDISRAPVGRVGGCLTGYFGTAGQVEAAGALVGQLRRDGGNPLVLCDPIVGDAGRFYVGADVRDGIHALARRADIVTPNRFELAFLAGVDFAALSDNAALVAAARGLGVREVVVTSAFAGAGETANLLVTADGAVAVVHRAVPRAPNGTGDLLAALYLARRLAGATPQAALVHAAGATLRLVEMADGGAELPLAAGQAAFAAATAGIRVEGVG